LSGNYRIYADVVHAAGFLETIVGSMTLPQISGRPLAGDDGQGTDTPVNAAPASATSSDQERRFKLADG
jgi:hypothetical protein